MSGCPAFVAAERSALHVVCSSQFAGWSDFALRCATESWMSVIAVCVRHRDEHYLARPHTHVPRHGVVLTWAAMYVAAVTNELSIRIRRPLARPARRKACASTINKQSVHRSSMVHDKHSSPAKGVERNERAFHSLYTIIDRQRDSRSLLARSVVDRSRPTPTHSHTPYIPQQRHNNSRTFTAHKRQKQRGKPSLRSGDPPLPLSS